MTFEEWAQYGDGHNAELVAMHADWKAEREKMIRALEKIEEETYYDSNAEKQITLINKIVRAILVKVRGKR